MIIALCIISASELAKVIPNFSYEMVEKDNVWFNDLLYSLGMDTTAPIERQEVIQHKNRFNEVVICDRWVGYERTDHLWIRSGHASVEARDKATNNKLIEDLYRRKGLTE